MSHCIEIESVLGDILIMGGIVFVFLCGYYHKEYTEGTRGAVRKKGR